MRKNKALFCKKNNYIQIGITLAILGIRYNKDENSK
jgi:hypothetical protein